MIALAEADACEDDDEGRHKRRRCLIEAESFSKMAERWEARKNATATNARLDILRELTHKLDERDRAAERLRGGKNKAARKAARPRGLDPVYHISDDEAIDRWGFLLNER
jgi:hypothetical protein